MGEEGTNERCKIASSLKSARKIRKYILTFPLFSSLIFGIPNQTTIQFSLIPNSSFSATILTALFTHRFLRQILGQILNPNFPKVDSTLGFLNCY
ncbi:hypothetical protein P8452_38910 [Trifolium repens]|nr:hypothetical protein P8452_38910 [Trifolium repens]